MFYTNVQPFGNNIAIRGVNNQGKSFQTKIPYEPTLYVHSQNPSKWRTLNGKKVSPVKWGSMKESYQAIKNGLQRGSFTEHSALWVAGTIVIFFSTQFSGDINDNRILWMFIGISIASTHVDNLFGLGAD